MRKLYTLAMLLAGSIAVDAKTTGYSVPNLIPQYGPGAGNVYPGANNSRMIAQSSFVYSGTDFIPVDSVTYSYSFGRGGQVGKDEMDDNFVNFDESYTYVYDAATNSYRNRLHRLQTFTLNNKAAEYTFQSWKHNSNSWADSARFVYNYDSDQTRLELAVFQIKKITGWEDHVPFDNVYDPSTGRLMEMNSIVHQMKFSYDGNNLVERKHRDYSFVYGAWRETELYEFGYNSAGQMISQTVRLNDGGWKNQEKYEYAYSGNDITTITEYKWNNGNWEVTGKHLLTYDAVHNKLNDVWQLWDATISDFRNHKRENWTYNNYAQPVTYYSQTWDAANGIWIRTADDFLRRYYYEHYTPTSVPKVEKAVVAVYPQPASSTIYVSLSEDLPGESNVQLFDMQGRVVKQTTMAARQSQTSLPVDELPAGNYVLNLVSGSERFTKTVLIGK